MWVNDMFCLKLCRTETRGVSPEGKVSQCARCSLQERLHKECSGGHNGGYATSPVVLLITKLCYFIFVF